MRNRTRGDGQAQSPHHRVEDMVVDHHMTEPVDPEALRDVLAAAALEWVSAPR